MRIAVDLLACQTDSRERGIGRYVLNLVDALTRVIGPEDEILLAIDGSDPARARRLRADLRRRGVRGTVLAYAYPAGEFTEGDPALVRDAARLRARQLRAFAPDVILIGSHFELGGPYTSAIDLDELGGIPVAAIAYDVIPLLFPERYLRPGEFITDWYPPKLAAFARFDAFLAISEATRADLVAHAGIADERITVIGAGLDIGLVATDGGCDRLAALGIDRPYVLMVGNADWRKNSLGALEAFAALPEDLRARHQLVFTRVGDEVPAAIAQRFPQIEAQVVIAGIVDDATLAQLYAHCRVFFFPSIYEGFGLPVLEAMAAGAPVLSSSLGSLPEVVHDARALFDPRNPAGTAAALRQALEDEGYRDVLRRDVRAHAATFTWERCARTTLSALRRLAAARTATRDRGSRVADTGAVTSGERNGGSGFPFADDVAARGPRRRLLVDITEVVRLDARSGIQRVTRNFCTGLAELAASGTFRFEPICWTESGIRYARRFARERLGAAVDGDDEPVRAEADDLVVMVDSSWWSPERFDALHDEVRARCGEVVWIVYDLIPITHAHSCDPVMPPVFGRWLIHAITGADGFVCISEATRAELEQFIGSVLPTDAPRPWTAALHLGADLESGRVGDAGEAAAAAFRAIGDRRYAVALGTVEPRKDYATVLAAFERLWSEGADVALVVIGKQGWNVEALASRLRSHPESGRRLVWLEQAKDGDIQALLRRATLLVQASIAEGFGLPVVEAARLGIPLLLSDIAVFREIAGSGARYFPVGDDAALAGQLRTMFAPQFVAPSAPPTLTWRESSAALLRCLLT